MMLYVNEILGASFCLFSVTSHYLKKIITDSAIQSFEVGSKISYVSWISFNDITTILP